MDMKKKAIRALIALAVVVALCMFFSGTLQTITTAKVRTTRAKNGRLEQSTELTGKAVFPDTQGLRVKLEDGASMQITKVNTRAGYAVKEGDVLIEGVIADYDANMKNAQTSYNEAMESLMQLEAKNANLRLRRSDQEYADCYYALVDAQKEELSARMDMEAQLGLERLQLTPDDEAPEGASEELMSLIELWQGAREATALAQEALNAKSRLMPEEDIWTYITEKRGYEDKIADAEEKMLKLNEQSAKAAAVTAPHDGYVVDAPLKEGENYDGLTDLMTLNAEGSSPVLRADVSNVDHIVAEGSVVTIRTERSGVIETYVTGGGVNEEGKRYVDIAITNDVLSGVGSVYTLMQNEISMTLVARASQATTLVPAAAVHGTGTDRYVFTVDTVDSGLGTARMTVHRTNVTVLGEADGTVSIQEDLGYYDLAYMEDRPLNDGDTVMQYME